MIEEVKEVVTQVLEKQGVLARLRAELRASVFAAVNDQDVAGAKGLSDRTSVANRQGLLATEDGLLAAALVQEFLQSCNLRFTLKVFEQELHAAKALQSRLQLSQQLGLDASTKDAPLLLGLLQKGRAGVAPAAGKLEPLALPSAMRLAPAPVLPAAQQYRLTTTPAVPTIGATATDGPIKVTQDGAQSPPLAPPALQQQQQQQQPDSRRHSLSSQSGQEVVSEDLEDLDIELPDEGDEEEDYATAMRAQSAAVRREPSTPPPAPQPAATTPPATSPATFRGHLLQEPESDDDSDSSTASIEFGNDQQQQQHQTQQSAGATAAVGGDELPRAAAPPQPYGVGSSGIGGLTAPAAARPSKLDPLPPVRPGARLAPLSGTPAPLEAPTTGTQPVPVPVPSHKSANDIREELRRQGLLSDSFSAGNSLELPADAPSPPPPRPQQQKAAPRRSNSGGAELKEDSLTEQEPSDASIEVFEPASKSAHLSRGISLDFHETGLSASDKSIEFDHIGADFEESADNS